MKGITDMKRLYSIFLMIFSLVVLQKNYAAEEHFISESDFIYHVGGQGNEEKIKPYLDASGNINAQDKKGMTALHWAAINGHVDIVERLIQEDADLNIQNNEGKTALQFAAGNGFVNIVSDLVHAGAQVNTADKRGQTALHWAVWKNHLPVVKLLMHDARPNINAKDAMGVTPLLWANDPEIFNELIQNDADITAIDNAGRSILHRATNPEVIQLALEQKLINQDLRDNEGMTPLMYAVSIGNIDVIPLLLQEGADVNLKDYIKGRSALHWAIRLREGSIIHEPTGSPEYLRIQQSRLPLSTVIKIINALAQDLYLDVTSKDNYGHDVYYYIQQPELFPSKEERELLLNTLQKIETEQQVEHMKTHGW